MDITWYSGQFAGSCWGCQQGDGLITADEPPTSSVTCICRTGNGNQELSSSLDLSKCGICLRPFIPYLWLEDWKLGADCDDPTL
jgi:hypothetical protein